MLFVPHGHLGARLPVSKVHAWSPNSIRLSSVCGLTMRAVYFSYKTPHRPPAALGSVLTQHTVGPNQASAELLIRRAPGQVAPDPVQADRARAGAPGRQGEPESRRVGGRVRVSIKPARPLKGEPTCQKSMDGLVRLTWPVRWARAHWQPADSTMTKP